MLVLLNLGHINDSSVLHISSDYPVEHLSDLVRSDELNVGNNVMLSTEIQHLLRLFDATNERSSHGSALSDARKEVQTNGVWRRSDCDKLPIQLRSSYHTV